MLSLIPLTLFGHKIFAAWVVDFVAAFSFGIAFQYFTIIPMKHLSPGAGLVAALKAGGAGGGGPGGGGRDSGHEAVDADGRTS